MRYYYIKISKLGESDKNISTLYSENFGELNFTHEPGEVIEIDAQRKLYKCISVHSKKTMFIAEDLHNFILLEQDPSELCKLIVIVNVKIKNIESTVDRKNNQALVVDIKNSNGFNKVGYFIQYTSWSLEFSNVEDCFLTKKTLDENRILSNQMELSFLTKLVNLTDSDIDFIAV